MEQMEDFTNRPLRYYTEKIQRRIFRRVLEYKVLDNRLQHDLHLQKGTIVTLLGISNEIVEGIEIKDHLEKACLTGIKAEFELYVTIYCTLVVNRLLDLIEETGAIPEQHKGLLNVVQDKNKFFRGFMQSGFKDARKFFIEQAIPSHGLERLTNLLDQCGWTIIDRLQEWDTKNFSAEFGGLIKDPWMQIRMAFQVRHAIEHSFSRVGKPFLYKSKDIWKESTWSRHFEQQRGPVLGERILLDGIDVCGTASAMTWASNVFLAHWEEWDL